jgi:hypothetical protein
MKATVKIEDIEDLLIDDFKDLLFHKMTDDLIKLK